mmetsp:Transcript_33444/g.93893  ORF Transcript_33444/g.93893 Transcript_33444/m.93893 type:complete len:213 (+) Transcript_33444:2211-2849(+)
MLESTTGAAGSPRRTASPRATPSSTRATPSSACCVIAPTAPLTAAASSATSRDATSPAAPGGGMPLRTMTPKVCAGSAGLRWARTSTEADTHTRARGGKHAAQHRHIAATNASWLLGVRAARRSFERHAFEARMRMTRGPCRRPAAMRSPRKVRHGPTCTVSRNTLPPPLFWARRSAVLACPSHLGAAARGLSGNGSAACAAGPSPSGSPSW